MQPYFRPDPVDRFSVAVCSCLISLLSIFEFKIKLDILDLFKVFESQRPLKLAAGKFFGVHHDPTVNDLLKTL